MNIEKSLALQLIKNYGMEDGYLNKLCKDDNGTEFYINWKSKFISIFPDGTTPPKNYKGYKGGESFNFLDADQFWISISQDALLSLNKVPYYKVVSILNTEGHTIESHQKILKSIKNLDIKERDKIVFDLLLLRNKEQAITMPSRSNVIGFLLSIG